MREKLTKIAIVVGGIIATLSPIALSVYVVDWEGRNAEQLRVQSYAHDALFRSEEVTRQIADAFKSLAGLEAKEGACGLSGVAEMRRIDLAYRYIQAIGKVAGTQMQCSSLGLSGADIELGPVDSIQPSGVLLRKDVRLPFARDVSFIVVEQSGYAAIINKELPIDTALGVEGVALATFSTANGSILTDRGLVDPAWIERFLQTGEEYFVTDAHVVSILGSNRFHIGSLAAMPASTILDRLRNAFLILIPIGFAAGLLIAGLFIHLAHGQRALPAVIRHALRRGEFFLMYQPMVDLQSGRWIGAEALIRWQRPTGETVGPDFFIPVAEQAGLISLITQRVIELVGRDARGVFSRQPDFHIALNLSTTDLYNEETARWLTKLMVATRATPGNIIVEITERAFTDAQKAAGVLETLRSKGIKVAVDDFGTGYSNIGLLQNFKLDYLKIDKSFVDSIGAEAANSGVVHHIVRMAKSLGLDLIAEGVETKEQVTVLLGIGVSYAQGWYFAKPMTYGELMAGLANREKLVRPQKERVDQTV